jgi:putative ABC transport system permease protein
MLRISWQTLRARRATLAGAFVAIALAVTLAYSTGLLMAGALSAPGPGRLAAADVVLRADPGVTVGHGDNAEKVDAVPGPQLPAAAVARASAVPGVARAVGDVAFAAGAFDAHGRPVAMPGADRLRGHGWASATLTPYRLSAGHAPAGPRDVVADARLGVRVGQTIRIVTPGGDAAYRITGLADGRASRDRGQAAVFFTASTAQALSGTPERVNAIGVIAAPGTSPAELRARLQRAMGPGVDILDEGYAAEADAGDPQATDRAGLIAIFGVMGGIAGAIALFVVAGTFALAIAQRRRETAVLRALGATPRQVRRLLAAEALILSAAASALGVLAGRPLALAIVDVLTDHGIAPNGFEPGHSWIPLLAAVGGGIGIAQLAVVAAARRAGRVRPSEALREVAIEHARPGWVQTLSGVLCLGGGIAMAIIFKGEAALAFSIIGGILLATGTALLGRVLLGLPTAALSLPLRFLGAPGLLASTSLATNRWRTAALATPIVLIAMLVGTQAIAQVSSQKHVENVTAERVTAEHVVVGDDGAPLPAGTSRRIARLPRVDAAAGMVPTSVFLLDEGLGWDTPWAAAGLAVADSARALDLHVTSGTLGDVRGTAVAVSEVAASEGHLEVGSVLHARMADTRAATLRVAAIYDRSAGLGDVVLDAAVARRHATTPADQAVFVTGGPAAARGLARYARTHPGIDSMTRAEYLTTLHSSNNENAWGVWLIVGLSVIFAALALVNTAAMSTGERRSELATIRLLGGTAGQATRMVALELAPIVVVALVAGVAIAALALIGVPDGVRGIPLVVPGAVVAGLLAGTVALGLAAGAVTARIALRASPASAMRAQE